MLNRIISAYKRISERSRLYGLEGALNIRKVEKSHRLDNTEEHPLITIRPPGARKSLWMRMGTSDPWVAQQVFVTQEYRPLIDIQDVRTIIDCGANVGYTSAYFLDHHPNAKIVAVEAQGENVELCRRNLRAYGERADLLHAAVWDRPGAVEVFCPQTKPENIAWAWRVRSPGEMDGHQGHATEELTAGSLVPAVTVGDLICRMGGSVDILKIDIEGAEAQVFAGDVSWLDGVRVLAIEIHWGDCQKIVDRAFQGREFQRSRSGEITLFWNPRYC